MELEIFPSIVSKYFHRRPHTWQSSAPAWRENKIRRQKKFNYRLHVDVTNTTGLDILDNFTHVSSWRLPPFKTRHVGRYSCVTTARPGLEERSVYLYTEDHRRPAVYHGKLVIQTEEYVPVTLPCLPSHPGVQVRVHRWDWRRRALHHDFREASTNFR